MKYRLSGKHFFFDREYDSDESVLEAVTRSRKAFQVQKHWIQRKVNLVVDENGLQIYPPVPDKYERSSLVRLFNEDHDTGKTQGNIEEEH